MRILLSNDDGVLAPGIQALASALREFADVKLELGVPSCVVIFEPQPREFFAPETAPARLARLRDKIELLASEGVDLVLCLPFNLYLSRLRATEFVDTVLVEGLGVKHLEVGDDFRFGCDRVGDFDFLQQASQMQGFTVEAAQTVKVEILQNPSHLEVSVLIALHPAL